MASISNPLHPGFRTLASVILAVVFLIVAALPAQATVPATMSYQGLLRDSGGAIPPDGQHAFVFRIFNVEAGGSALWQESQTLMVTGGIFNATLGAVTPLALPFDVQYWLETVVDGGTLAPRVKLASAPYAQRAAVAEALAGGGGGGDITAVYADNGLTGGATSGDAHLAVGAGAGISVSADAVAVDGVAVAGSGLVAEGASSVAVNPGTGLSVVSDQVRLTDPYATGTAYDSRFVNEAQTNSVTTDMITPNVVASVDGVVNDGGNIDLVAGANVTITPDDVNNTITISATGGGGGIGGSGTTGYVPKFTGATTIGNSLLHDTGSRIGIGTASPVSRFTISAPDYEGVEVVAANHPAVLLSAANTSGTGWIDFRRGGVPKTWMSESSAGLKLERNAESGGIVMSSTTADPYTNSVFSAKYTGSAIADHVAVYGYSAPLDYYGIGGKFIGGYLGVLGRVEPTGSSSYYYGVYGECTGGSGTNVGVIGSALYGNVNYGVYGQAYTGSGSSYAGYFTGNVHVVGNLTTGGIKQFRIDHPLDPANKYLNHYCVESDEVLNTYRGNVVLDQDGSAWVALPEWYDRLNTDPTYQLTCIGGQAQVYVAEEISNQRFRIAGGKPGLKVSWQVTAVRSDPAAAKYRVPVEQVKPAPERGKYLEPELYGAPEELRVGRITTKTQG